jgi:hypothetical protein
MNTDMIYQLVAALFVGDAEYGSIDKFRRARAKARDYIACVL